MECYTFVLILWEGLGGFAGQGVGLVLDLFAKICFTLLGFNFDVI